MTGLRGRLINMFSRTHGAHAAPVRRRGTVWRVTAAAGMTGSALFTMGALTTTSARADSGSTLAGSPFNGSDGVLDTTPSGVISAHPDLFNSSSDNVFGSSPAAKEQQVCPTISIGPKPDQKSDLKAFYIGVDTGTTTATASDHFLYLAWSRVATSGDANIDFELNQSTSSPSCTSPTVNKLRTPGDILLQYNFQSTTGAITLSAYRWVTSGTCDIGSISTFGGCWHLDSLAGSSSEASVSSDKSFGEMVINLNASGIFQSGVCENLGSGFAKSRASQSADADLKDYVAPVGIDVVNCAPTTTTTTPSNKSFDLGGSLTDGVTVDGTTAGGAPVGNVAFYVCSDTTTGCDPTSSGAKLLTGGTNPVDLSPSTTVADESTATSPSYTPPAPGNYCFAGVYTPTGSSVGVYFGSSDTSVDECFVVKALTPGFTTTPAHTSITLGDSVNDTATVTGTDAGGVPTGTVAWTFCDGATCTAAPTTATSSSGTDPATFTSTSVTPTKAGTWCFSASFTSTNSNYNSVSVETNPTEECVTVNPATSKTATQISPSDGITLSNTGSVSDTVTVTGNSAGGSPTGSVSFYICQTGTDAASFQPGVCPPGTSTPVAETADLSPSGDGLTSTTTSNSFIPTSTGTWCFSAVYGGDPNYLSSQDNTVAASGDNPGNADSNECVLVSKASSSITTSVFDETSGKSVGLGGSITLGDTVHDTSTVNGTVTNVAPTGSVAYTFFDNNTCSGDGTSAGGGSIGANSGSEGPLTAGSYSFQATYSGDSNYSGSVSGCEPFSVNQGSSATATSVFDETSGQTVNGPITLGDTVHDTSTVTGTPPAFSPTGTVSYRFFDNNTCSGDGTAAGGGSIGANSDSEGPLAAGNYSFQATYSGDPNYTGSTSACEPFTVSAGTSATSTTVFDASTNTAWSGTEAAPASAYDTTLVTTSDGFVATGTVNYTFFSNGDCGVSEDTGGTPAGTVTLTDTGAVPNSNTETALAPGSYSFQATYSGDKNYAGSTGACEPFTVLVPPTVTAVKSSNPTDGSIVHLGDTVTYTITLTNSGQVDANNVTVTDQVPTGTTFVAGSAAVNGTADPSITPDSSGVLTWSGITVPADNGTATVSFQVTVNSNDTDGEVIPNHALFTNTNTPGCTGDTCSTNTVTVTVEFPIVTAVKSSNPATGSTVLRGDKIVYTIKLTNSGMLDATNVVVTDTVPTGTTFVSADPTATPDSSGLLTWTIADIAANGGTASVSFTVTVNSNDTNNEVIPNVALFTNTNTPSSGCANPDPTTGTCHTNTVQVTVHVPVLVPSSATAPAQKLAFTGADALRTAELAFAALGFGSLLLIASRRRRRRMN
jgi:large repetitive protein